MQSFQQEILALISATYPDKSRKQRNINISMRLFGWDGRGGCTLSEAGIEFNLTRERVRQVAKDVADDMRKAAKGRLTSVIPLINLLQSKMPGSAARIEAELADHGLNGDRVEGLLKAADLFFDDEFDIKVVHEAGSRFLINNCLEGSASLISSKAQKVVSHQGAVRAEDLFDLVPNEMAEFAPGFTRDVLISRGDCHWLDSDKSWLWLSRAPRNRLITCMHKIMSFYASATSDDAMAGVRRYFKKGTTKTELPVTEAQFEAIMRTWSQVNVSDEGIIRRSDIFSSPVRLNEYEVAIANVILSNPDLTAREKELELALVPDIDGETHNKKYNFSMALNYSPLIRRIKRGIYTTTGNM